MIRSGSSFFGSGNFGFDRCFLAFDITFAALLVLVFIMLFSHMLLYFGR